MNAKHNAYFYLFLRTHIFFRFSNRPLSHHRAVLMFTYCYNVFATMLCRAHSAGARGSHPTRDALSVQQPAYRYGRLCFGSPAAYPDQAPEHVVAYLARITLKPSEAVLAKKGGSACLLHTGTQVERGKPGASSLLED